MVKQVSRILSTIFFLGWAVVPVFGQGLSAKANGVVPQPAAVSADSDRVHDGLAGPVRRVRTEVVKVSGTSGRIVEEEKRTLLETAEYDIKGTKTQNQYFPVAGSLTGREVYKYDDKGNISEMTLLSSDGALISKEVYKYEFDSVGNWTKMVTSVAVVENGKINFEPSEYTYRTIFYYLDEKMARMLEPAQGSQPVPANSNPDNTNSTGAGPEKLQADSSNNRSENSGTLQVGSNKSAAELPAVIALDRSKISQSQVTPPEVRDTNARPSVGTEGDPPPVNNNPKPIMRPVSRGVLNGAALSLPSPTYPDIARRMRAAGVVTVEVVIGEDGKVISAKAISGPTLLSEVAVQAAYRARFSPTKLSGQAVKVTGTINYNFKLGQ